MFQKELCKKFTTKFSKNKDVDIFMLMWILYVAKYSIYAMILGVHMVFNKAII